LLIVFAAAIFLINDKMESRSEATWSYSKGYINFLNRYHINGRMYNDFSVGGFIEYYLYPRYQVFYDGRVDTFKNKEMRDFYNLMINKRAYFSDFRKLTLNFLNRYQFSFVIININNYNPLEFSASTLMVNVLREEPDWRLIYFDDKNEIFLKNDGKNDHIYQSFGMTAITPLRLIEYRSGQEKQAIKDFEKMISVEDSGLARNGLGQIFLTENQFDKAGEEFNKAAELNPFIGRPLWGLGQIALKKNDINGAINLFKEAIDISPYRGEFYLSIADAYNRLDDKNSAISYLKQGLNQNIDFISRQKIAIMLNNLQH
jgi:tetratricopeptide (TPR) repeat protein